MVKATKGRIGDYKDKMRINGSVLAVIWVLLIQSNRKIFLSAKTTLPLRVQVT